MGQSCVYQTQGRRARRPNVMALLGRVLGGAEGHVAAVALHHQWCRNGGRGPKEGVGTQHHLGMHATVQAAHQIGGQGTLL
eukprot:4087737-Amphidinium_carterae.1